MILTVSDMNIGKIMRSGECFRLRETWRGEYLLPARGRILRLRQTEEMEREEQVELLCSEEELREVWREYFDLGTDYRAVRESIDPMDGFLRASAEAGRGIRILKQDLWEVMVSFVISQNNNIPRIRRSIEGLCERFGEELRDCGETFFLFPAPERLRDVTREDLQGLSLGYRDIYVADLIRAVLSGETDPYSLHEMSYPEAKRELMKLKGIGGKVADCICLFGLHHTEAFPMDTHMKQILSEHYPEGFPLERYGKAAGILQQFMFYGELTDRQRKHQAKSD